MYRLGEALADTIIAQQQRRCRRVRRVTVDLDLTEDATRGTQQLALFNGFYVGWCYLPLLAFLTFDHEPRQYLVTAIHRPGTAPATVGAPGLLRRLLPKLWQTFSGATVRVRLDGGFASPGMFALLEDAGVECVVAMAKHLVLLAAAAPSSVDARTAAGVAARSARVFADTTYQAKTWRQARRVITKATSSSIRAATSTTTRAS